MMKCHTPSIFWKKISYHNLTKKTSFSLTLHYSESWTQYYGDCSLAKDLSVWMLILPSLNLKLQIFRNINEINIYNKVYASTAKIIVSVVLISICKTYPSDSSTEFELMCPFPLGEYLKVQTHLRSSIIWHVIFHSFK